MPPEKLTGIQKNEWFVVFSEFKWGFRVIVIILKNYKMLYGVDTVQKIVDRYAPSTENNISVYAHFVADRFGVSPMV